MESFVQTRRPAASPIAVAVFVLIAVAGLFYVKWSPYYARLFVAAGTHSIGHSILSGTASTPPAASWQAALHYASTYGRAIWQAMVLGLLLGSAVQTLLPAHWIARVLGAGLRSVAAGGVLALPGMMCTCCAAPVVVGLRKRQASQGAAVAFWLGNSVLNPATLVFMGFVLGWHWTALRLVLGVLLVFGGGWLVDATASAAERASARAQLQSLEIAGESPQGNAFARWLKLLAQMTVRLVPEYIVLVLLLGAARAWLFPHVGPEVDNAISWIVAFAAAGTLFVIPTAGEVPIVQTMLSFGVAAGPAAALMMTLPPISVPSLVMTARALGTRVVVMMLLMVLATGIMAGCIAAALHL